MIDKNRINTNLILREISENWKLEARDENNSRYFYNTNEVSKILKGNKCYVIGRKGTGKTAIREYIYQLNDNQNIFTEKLTFKNFPFNTLYKQKNVEYTPPNQYITLWKLLIYSVIAKMMLRNKTIDKSVKESLSLSYRPDKLTTLVRIVPEWLAKQFDVLPIANDKKYGEENELPWITNVQILEDIILEHLDNGKYYIIFDELDEDYRDKTQIEDYTQYSNLITSLFKSVQDINSTFRNSGKNIYPIIFLRDDIYTHIKDADKNKWSDYKLELEWTEEKIKELLAFRISKAISEKGVVNKFDDVWGLIFQWTYNHGDYEKNIPKLTTFNYIFNSTQLRPRDFVSYITQCAEDTLSFNINSTFISKGTVNKVDKQFSNYLKREITDEIFPVLPDIDEIFRVISEIRKKVFSINEFKKAYEHYLNHGTIKEPNINYVLQTLFDFSVIGNQHATQKNKQFFKYKNKEAKFNFSEDLCIHKGLHKALQIL